MTHGVNYSKTAGIFKALSNPLRLTIVHTLLRDGCRNVRYLEQTCHMSQSCISQHLQKLRQENVVCAQRVGNQMLYRICDPAVETMLAQFLEQEDSHAL